jgi:energy-converting hydrogenase Eha subunit E
MKTLAQVSFQQDFFSGSGAKLQNLTNIGDLVSFFIKGSFAVAGTILVIFFILGGIGLMSGAGKSDPKQIEQAKQSLSTAVVGFLIVFLAYWVVRLLLKIFGVEYLIF